MHNNSGEYLFLYSCSSSLFLCPKCWPYTIMLLVINKKESYRVSQKEWYIAKWAFWGPIETVFSLLWFLVNLYRIPGLVYVPKGRFLCPYIAPYSPYKHYRSHFKLFVWLLQFLSLFTLIEVKFQNGRRLMAAQLMPLYFLSRLETYDLMMFFAEYNRIKKLLL